MTDQVFIQHRFTIEKDGKSYSDALVLPLSEYEKLSQEDIEIQKQQRFDNWKTVIATPLHEPTKEEQLTQTEQSLVSINQQIASLQEQKVALSQLKVELTEVIALDEPVEVIKGVK